MQKIIYILLGFIILSDCSLSAQSKPSNIITVSGTIKDEDGKKIRGRVSVLVNPDPNRDPSALYVDVVPIKNGIYKKEAYADGELEIHCSGYFSQRIKVDNRTEIDVALEKDDRILMVVSGKVTDEEGKSLFKVAITCKSHPKDIISGIIFRTDKNGFYNFGTSDTDTLTFSFDGYKPQEIPMNKREEINVVMKKVKKKESSE